MKTDIRILKALTLIAGKEEARPYLNGVHMRQHGEHVIFEATDGHIAAMIRVERNGGAFPNVIIPRDLIERIKLNKRFTDCLIEAEGRSVSITHDDATYTGQSIAGEFPCVPRILPKEVSGETAQFNPDLLARFLKARRLFDPKARLVSIAHNGEGPALVNFCPDLDSVGVAMPMRIHTAHVLAGAPDWAFETEAKQLEAAE
jgi:DNA polymerase-3 subunit beta